MAHKLNGTEFSEETIKKKRRFPVGKTVLLVILAIIQVIILTAAIRFNPTPPDRIDYYGITAEPMSDGSIRLDYCFIWTPLDTSEELTWVEIGMANADFEFLRESLSSNITSCEKYTDGDYVSARLYLDRGYSGGETLTFTFSVTQRNMLCKDEAGYFYEFVPSWFNATPVESYCFVWKGAVTPTASNADTKREGYPAWEGSMPCGSYVKMNISYPADAFNGAATAEYEEFYDGDVTDSLKDDKIGAIIMAVIVCIIILVFQIYMVDSVVSYNRGRGFLTGYGHHIHLYGSTNPKYRRAAERHAASSRSSGRSGGSCACACACACAGGGRAGCSQKDTYAFPIRKTDNL